MTIRCFVFCDICNPQAIRTIECRRSNRSEELRNGRRISDGRAWFEGDLETAVQQAGWLVTPENRHICPACRKTSRT